MQPRTVEQIAGAPQFVGETVEAERLVPRERVQRTNQRANCGTASRKKDVVPRAASLMREAFDARRAFELSMNEEPF